MQTDKELFHIFRACPELIFLLAHLPAPRGCKLTSVTVKALQRTMDGLIVPDDPAEPVIIIEIQFQRSSDIYQRVIVEMVQVQLQHYPQRLVQGIICFARASLDPGTEPWKSSGLVRCIYLQDEIEKLERQKPDHPLVAVLKPVFETSEETLEKEAAIHYRHLQQSDLSPEQRETLCEAYASLLIQRLKNRNPIDLAMILELPDIRDTVFGKEMMAEGQVKELRGNVCGIATRKFGTLPSDVTTDIQNLDHDQGTELLYNLLDMSKLGDLQRWLAERRS